jgi:hypothetical protein
MLQRRPAAVVLGLAQIGVPISALDSKVGHQMMQVGLMHHHHARMAHGRLVNEIVVGVVANLVERQVEFLRMILAPAVRESLDFGQTPQRIEQGL